MPGLKTSGLNRLQEELKEAQIALASLNGEIASLKFDPEDRKSVERAIQKMEAAIDTKIEPYRNNKIVASIAQGLKESYRSSIRERADIDRV